MTQFSPAQRPVAPASEPAPTLVGRPTKRLCLAVNWGRLDYLQAWERQNQLVKSVQAGQQPNTLALLEHPHVYTRGRLAKSEHLKLTPAQLADRGIAVVDTDRGGQITYHGPGQLVAWPVINLREWGGPVKYLRSLEEIIINVLADFGVAAERATGLTGVWVGPAKIAAIGVKISQGIAHHGFAINVNPDLTWFDHIVPCGITDRPVTSMAQVIASSPTTSTTSSEIPDPPPQPRRLKKPLSPEPERAERAAVRRSVIQRFGQCMGYQMATIES